MLKNLRENTRNWGMYILFGLLVLVFAVGFNPATDGSLSCSLGGGSHVARLMGRKISREEFREAANSFQRFNPLAGQRSALDLVVTRALYQPAQLGSLTQATLGLPGQREIQATMDLLLSREVLSQAALEMGFSVTEDEIDAEILQPSLPGRPTFLDNDKFDYESFKDYVAYGVRVSMKEYRDDIRRQLLAKKMADFLASQVKVSEEEVKWRYELEETRASLEYIKIFVAGQREKITISDEEAKAYADNHPEEIQKEYDANQDEYGEQVKARHILIKTASNASEAEINKAKEEIDEIHKQLTEGADFAALATEKSQDPVSAVQGGDLGWFGKGQMVPEFTEAAFSTPVGEFSAPFKSGFGWHIVKVEEKKDAKSLEEVSLEIARKLAVEDKAKSQAKAIAENFLADAKALSPEDSLEKILPATREDTTSSTPASAPASAPAEETTPEDPYAPKVETTTSFSRYQNLSNGVIPGLGKSEALSKIVFTLTAEAPVPDEVFEIGDAFVVVRLKERSEPDMEKFKEELAQRREQTLSFKKFAFLNDWLNNELKKAEEAGRIEFFKENLNMTFN